MYFTPLLIYPNRAIKLIYASITEKKLNIENMPWSNKLYKAHKVYMNKEIITMRKTSTEAPIPASIKPTCSVMKFWFTVLMVEYLFSRTRRRAAYHYILRRRLMVEYRIISPDNSSTKFIITVCSTLLLSWNVYWPKNLLENRPWQKKLHRSHKF